MQWTGHWMWMQIANSMKYEYLFSNIVFKFHMYHDL